MLKQVIIDSQLYKIQTFAFRHAKYISEMKISDSLLQKMKQQTFTFRQNHLEEYRFPGNLTGVLMNNYNFHLPERYQNLYRYYFQCLTLEGLFNHDLKNNKKIY